jgi:hypothetical protein
LLLVFFAALTVAFGATAKIADAAPPSLDTGLFDPSVFVGDTAPYTTARSLGATFVRLHLTWTNVAPPAPPDGFDASDPTSAGYDWSGPDGQVQNALANGLTPILDIVDAPSWGRLPAGAPDSAALGTFAHAAALHFQGSVRYWQVWNEPNLATKLSPQIVGGVPYAPKLYRSMVNAVAAGVKAVSASNLVVAGGLAPFRDITPATQSQDPDWGPLSFMRSLLCVSVTLKPTCHQPVRFDIWSTHPYTSGGPTHHAVLGNDVSLGDLPKMRAVLTAAQRAGAINSRGTVRFWVTEFGWDSAPPDPKGVPAKLLTRWVPQALYVMWKSGVSLVTWFLLKDQPMTTSYYQSGLLYGDGSAKPYAKGFRFPLVAFPASSGCTYWGRTPPGTSGRLDLQVRVGTAWRTAKSFRIAGNTVFQGKIAGVRSGWVRARFAATGDTSLPFGLTQVPDRFFNPFGEPTLLEPVHP